MYSIHLELISMIQILRKTLFCTQKFIHNGDNNFANNGKFKSCNNYLLCLRTHVTKQKPYWIFFLSIAKTGYKFLPTVSRSYLKNNNGLQAGGEP